MNNKLEETEAQWIERHTTDFLYANTFTAVFGTTAASLIIAYSIRSNADADLLSNWITICLSLQLFRVLSVLIYRQQEKPHYISWKYFHFSMTLLSGTIIGSSYFFFFDGLSPILQLVLLSTIVGLCAGALGTHAADTLAFYAFMFPACLTPTVMLYLQETIEYTNISLLFVIFMVVMTKSAREGASISIRNLQLTYTLYYRATHDSLVGLLNREEFERSFKLIVPSSPHKIALMFVDLDNFKLLNDTFGHDKGDQALTKVAEIISENIRRDDISARFGGDEFVVLLFVDSVKIAETIGSRIINQVSKINLGLDDNFVGLGCSIGLAYSKDTKVDYDLMLKAADNACYESKSAGKNCISIGKV